MRTSQIRRRRLPEPVIGAFDGNSLSDFVAMKAAKMTHALIEYRWDTAQPDGPLTPLDPTIVTEITNRIKAARQAGLRVQFQIAFHYTPAWVDTPGSIIPKFKNQYGTQWSEVTDAGRNVRDWYFTAVGRQYLGDFIQRCLATLDFAQIDSMRTGPGWYGETNYPPSPDLNTFHWWAYGDAPQTGTGLASGMSVCPVPGYIPFSGTPANDTLFTEWYLDSLADTLQWLIDQHRTHGWKRDLFILQQGFGLRSSMAYGSTDYQRQACVGADWERQLAVYAGMTNTFVQCTWIDGIHPYASDLSIEGNRASWYQLRELAKNVAKDSRLSGENTATNWTYLDEDRVFQLDALKNGYRDMWFLTYPSLAAATSPIVDLTHTTQNIAYLRDSTAAKPDLILPTAVSSPVLYLTADQGVTQSGNLISDWADQSGNGNNVITATGSARPTFNATGGPNNAAYVSFDGASNFLTLASSAFNLTSYTIFVVARTYSAGAFMAKIGGASGNSLRKLELGMSGTGQFYTRAGSDSDYNEYYSVNSLFSSWHLYSTTMRTGDDFDMNIDGANQTRNVADGSIGFAFNPTPFNSGLLAIGREGATGSYSQVDITQVLIIPSALDVAARQSIETYFRLAYGIF